MDKSELTPISRRCLASRFARNKVMTDPEPNRVIAAGSGYNFPGAVRRRLAVSVVGYLDQCNTVCRSRRDVFIRRMRDGAEQPLARDQRKSPGEFHVEGVDTAFRGAPGARKSDDHTECTGAGVAVPPLFADAWGYGQHEAKPGVVARTCAMVVLPTWCGLNRGNGRRGIQPFRQLRDDSTFNLPRIYGDLL
jgi:hypothetical protein